MMIKPELVPLRSQDFSVIEPIAKYYEYDMARYCGRMPGWEFPLSGNYFSPALKKSLKSYFTEKDRYPFLIRMDERPAGFVMVNKVGTSPLVDWNMGEFFVLAPYQRRKVGQTIALQIFEQFKGEWEVAVIPQNKGALDFWKPLINQFSQGKFSQETKTLQFPEMHKMIVFAFASN